MSTNNHNRTRKEDIDIDLELIMAEMEQDKLYPIENSFMDLEQWNNMNYFEFKQEQKTKYSYMVN